MRAFQPAFPESLATPEFPTMRIPLRKLLLSAAIGLSPLAAGVAFPGHAMAYPKPSLYPISWELKFTHAAPRRIVVTTPGTNVPVAYWYMTYTVTNLTDREQQFLPVFEMVTDSGKTIRSDDQKEIPSAAFDAIKKREKNRMLEPVEKISGRVLIGEDQARDGVAIWVEPTRRMGTFHIFAAGLNGETTFLKDGEEVAPKDVDALSIPDRKKLLTLRKTLEMTYQIAGDEIKPDAAAVLPKGEEWLMR
jgi:hypothetical protein